MIQQVVYNGSTPGADSNTYTLFDSTVTFSAARFAQALGASKLCVVWKQPGANSGLLKAYRSIDRGVTWQQVDQATVSQTASTASNSYELLIESLPDYKLDFVNGGSAQTAWTVDISLVSQRTPAA